MHDNVFGELTYNNGWERILQCSFWNVTKVKIKISAYETEEPNENQRKSYARLCDNIQEISEKSYKKLKGYLQLISEEILPYCGLKQMPENICEIISVNHLIFMESGNFAIMCDTKWDDHGVAVLCTENEMMAGPQDIVWMEE